MHSVSVISKILVTDPLSHSETKPEARKPELEFHPNFAQLIVEPVGRQRQGGNGHNSSMTTPLLAG